MTCGLSNGHVTDDVTWPWKVKLVTPIHLKRNISKTTWARDFKFGMPLCMGNAERAHKNFPWSGRGLSHVTPKNFGMWSNISPKLLGLETTNLVHGFVWRIKTRRTKISPKSGHGLTFPQGVNTLCLAGFTCPKLPTGENRSTSTEY